MNEDPARNRFLSVSVAVEHKTTQFTTSKPEKKPQNSKTTPPPRRNDKKDKI
jgi:hypothetical protein